MAKLGVKQTAPLAAMYGPAKRGSFGVYNFNIEQASSKIQQIIRHSRAHSPQGLLILITYRWWQLFSGMPLALLQYPQQVTQHLPQD